MKTEALSKKTIEIIEKFQRNEITEYHIYSKLAKIEKNADNKQTLQKIAEEENRHYDFWKSFTNREISPNRLRIFFYYWIVRILGITFGIKLMEKGEVNAQDNYNALLEIIPDVQSIIAEEDKHENELIGLIQEEKLNYVGSIVLGLNDALVELTGALAGFSFALQNTKLIAFAGVITGIAAALSMAAAEYLSQSHEGIKAPARSALYTGVTYLFTVVLLILPYLILSNYIVCLVCTIVIALIIILIFNYYISVAKDLSFKRRFFEMAAISLSVSFITFLFSALVKIYFHVDI
jgi:VIT1/CCC1 family predicted Fe2+/Mn2+ transporter